jgi:hypothetical protein
MKITKGMFKSFEGLEELKKMQKEGCCSGIKCSRCPLGEHNTNATINCADITSTDRCAENNSKQIKKMNKLIDIFTKENINSVLSELVPNRKLRYNDYVVYNDKTFKIKGVVKSELTNLILLNGHDMDRAPSYESCIINRKAIKKAYTLWVEPTEIFALNDIVIEKKSGIEHKIVAIGKPDLPILLNAHVSNLLNINDCEDVLCSIPEAHEENYSKWVSSHDILFMRFVTGNKERN